MKPALPNILEQSNSFISNFFFFGHTSLDDSSNTKYGNQLYEIYKKI